MSDWVPKIIKLFKKSDRSTQTCYITHTKKKKKKEKKEKKKKRKEKESEIMNRKGIVESDEKQKNNLEGQSSEDRSLTLQVVLSIKVFSMRKMEAQR